MNSLERAAMFEHVASLIEEIDSIFEEHGYDPSDFDPESEEFSETPDGKVGKVYGHIHSLKEALE